MEVAHAGCGSRVTKLERRVSELGGYLQRSEQKYQLLDSEKVDSLTQVNEGLMIQVESLEHDVVNHDRVVTALKSSTNVAQRDLDWLLRVGLM